MFEPSFRSNQRCRTAFAVVATMAALLVMLASVTAHAKVSDKYIINPGDRLDITVWQEEGLSREVLVRPDGIISFPLVGHIRAAGRTARYLEAVIRSRLTRFVEKPVVTVSVLNTNGNIVFLIGQVRKPGPYAMSGRITVVQALTLAGGLTPFGDERRIIIIRKFRGKQTRIPFNYAKIKKGLELNRNILLKSGDVIVIPED